MNLKDIQVVSRHVDLTFSTTISGHNSIDNDDIVKNYNRRASIKRAFEKTTREAIKAFKRTDALLKKSNELRAILWGIKETSSIVDGIALSIYDSGHTVDISPAGEHPLYIEAHCYLSAHDNTSWHFGRVAHGYNFSRYNNTDMTKRTKGDAVEKACIWVAMVAKLPPHDFMAKLR